MVNPACYGYSPLWQQIIRTAPRANTPQQANCIHPLRVQIYWCTTNSSRGNASNHSRPVHFRSELL